MLKNLSYYTASLIVTSIISILTVPIFTRYLTVSDYGILAIYGLCGGAWINILSIGMTSASVMFFAAPSVFSPYSTSFRNPW